MKVLYLIPARGGSKGVPGKNVKPLAGKPLITYAIDAARGAGASDEDICVSTDDAEIARVVEEYGLAIPFMRPDSLAQDNSGTYEVIIHALDHYATQGIDYDVVVLLQPTSPMRTSQHVAEALALYDAKCDMVVSVTEARSNPYYVMFHEDESGYLRSLMNARFARRQDCLTVWEYNGAVYVMNVTSLREKHLSQFDRRIKYVMSARDSVDIDTPDDWEYAQFLMTKK